MIFRSNPIRHDRDDKEKALPSAHDSYTPQAGSDYTIPMRAGIKYMGKRAVIQYQPA
jgi:hypothetical protein